MFQSTNPLLTKQNLEVAAKGELVLLTVGNSTVSMHYTQALNLSTWVRTMARRAKRVAGRGSSIRSLGRITDLSAPTPKPLPNYRGTTAAIHVVPSLLTFQEHNVRLLGRLVQVDLGSNQMEIHYQTALKLSQWLRVRAKEARNTAGDTRHWADIVDDNAEHN